MTGLLDRASSPAALQERQPAVVDRDHIICVCRPNVTYCGVFDDTPMNEHPIDGSECVWCFEVYMAGVCPNCGCGQDNWCDLCDKDWEDGDG